MNPASASGRRDPLPRRIACLPHEFPFGHPPQDYAIRESYQIGLNRWRMLCGLLVRPHRAPALQCREGILQQLTATWYHLSMIAREAPTGCLR